MKSYDFNPIPTESLVSMSRPLIVAGGKAQVLRFVFVFFGDII